MKIVACPSCKQIVRISDESHFCTECGQYIKKHPSPRKNYLWLINIVLIVIVGISALLLYQYIEKKPKSTSSTYHIPAKPSVYTLFTLKINKFVVKEYNTYEIVGIVKNISSRPLRFVHIKVMFYDSGNNIVGEDTTYACSTDYIMPDQTKSFKLLGENQTDYKRVRAEIIDYMEVE